MNLSLEKHQDTLPAMVLTFQRLYLDMKASACDVNNVTFLHEQRTEKGTMEILRSDKQKTHYTCNIINDNKLNRPFEMQ